MVHRARHRQDRAHHYRRETERVPGPDDGRSSLGDHGRTRPGALVYGWATTRRQDRADHHAWAEEKLFGLEGSCIEALSPGHAQASTGEVSTDQQEEARRLSQACAQDN